MKSTWSLRDVSAQASFRTAELTEEVVDLIGATVGQAHSEESVNERAAHPPQSTKDHHCPTQPWAHDNLVPEWVADGHISIIGHDREQPALSDAQHQKDVHLGHTPNIRDSFSTDQMHQHLGTVVVTSSYPAWRGHRGKVHGCMEAGVPVD